MERFAFKIDKALKANLYKICRLCGIDNPDKVPILDKESPIVDVDEPELCTKIQTCVGFKVAKDDKMPQSICTLCVDKINDFYEFREMCFATDAQTRKLLGLKNEVIKEKLDVVVKPEVDIKDEPQPPQPKKRGRKRKCEVEAKMDIKVDVDEMNKETAFDKFTHPPLAKKMRLVQSLAASRKILIPSKKQKRIHENPVKPAEKKLKSKEHNQAKLVEKKLKTKEDGQLKPAEKKLKPKEEIKDEPPESSKLQPPPPSFSANCKLKMICNICDERFSTKGKLERHQASVHVPSILRYVCTACNETLKKGTDIKNHQLWHKLSQTPYVCALCQGTFLTIYMYTKHLRDHCTNVSGGLLVLDRQCAQCHHTFSTNFLYNTHACAIKTKKCGGCNRQQRNEIEFIRHSAACPAAYHNHSKHIPIVAGAAESCIRIKNEIDVEAAAAAEEHAHNRALPMNMEPTVSVTRMPSPMMMATDSEANQKTKSPEKKTKKVGRRGATKKDMKRIDELLKSTIDTFVSIKHEPEVHVDTDMGAPHLDIEPDASNDADHHNDDDFHSHSTDDEGATTNQGQAEEPRAEQTMSVGVIIKQEKLDDSYKDSYNNMELNIKKEVADVDHEDTANSGKMPVLKIKITKEHGTLNSSIVEDGKGQKKKKKKEKKREKTKGKTLDNIINSEENAAAEANTSIGTSTSSSATATLLPGGISVKQERLDEDELAHDFRPPQPEATIMTSIPMMQFQISCVSSGVDFNGEKDEHEAGQAMHSFQQPNDEPEDVKPNKADLDRMLQLQITNVQSGVNMEAVENAVTHNNEDVRTEKITTTTTRKQKPHAHRTQKAKVDTTAAAQKPTPKMPVIAAVVSGFEMPENHHQTEDEYHHMELPIIKAEPLDRGYGDEIEQPDINCDEMLDHLPTYVDGIDISGVTVKQEKDFEATEMQISDVSGSYMLESIHGNAAESGGIYEEEDSDETEEEEGEEEEDEEDEEEAETEDEGEREYREIEMPPLLSEQEEHAEKEAYDILKPNGAQVMVDHREVTEGNEISEREHRAKKDAVHNNEVQPITVQDVGRAVHDTINDDEDQQMTELHIDKVTRYDTIQGAEDKQITEHHVDRPAVESGQDIGGTLMTAANNEVECIDKEVRSTSERVTIEEKADVGRANIENQTQNPAPFVITNVYRGTEVLLKDDNTEIASSKHENRENKKIMSHAQCPNEGLQVEEDKEAKHGKDESITVAKSINKDRQNDEEEEDECSSNTLASNILEYTKAKEPEEYLQQNKEEQDLSHRTVNADDSLPSSSLLPVTTIGMIVGEKEATLEAQPFFEPTATTNASGLNNATLSTDDDLQEEEQQNLLNQEMLDLNSSEMYANTTTTPLHLDSFTTDNVASTSAAYNTHTLLLPSPSIAAPVRQNSEETENLINETADAALSQQQQQLHTHSHSRSPPHPQVMHMDAVSNFLAAVHFPLLDDSNLNEIAENNNNANIERELQDDQASSSGFNDSI